MTAVVRPKAFGAGLIALDVVVGLDPQAPIRSWAGGTCGNVLSALAYLGWDSYPIARLNGDPASVRVRDDMARWGVHMDYANCSPTAHTPIIIQEIRRGRDGRPKHRFSWSCPQCGQWLPGFKAVTIEAVEKVTPALTGASVFFLDRVSRATLTLAAQAAERGAVVIFEPSSKATDKLFAEAVSLAHIVKYSDQRLAGVQGVMKDGSATLVEIQTLGEQGLRYRHRLGRSASNWLHLSAIAAPRLTDSCGSGDWCTAGLIAKIAAQGRTGLRQAGAQGLRGALRYGQALAAWNCGFEGARGGMYAVTHKAFDQQIAALLAGQLDSLTEGSVELGSESIIACPACPPESPNRKPMSRGRSHLKKAAA
ncbi:carbohydrate kinase [Bradyrhizobium sp. 190]|uniref:PfkB family carbohydrate kinase n=1 Tax=Bradyrhizobium sp. 190 TaxID=2782658 RepID=UPI001FF7B59F|nr:PfkB family carbohydrate kinase [Bradyrhizobium sp. 190]MCK1515626.1 carbohydrate kinase [Bradyrhizobium sp. 190]